MNNRKKNITPIYLVLFLFIVSSSSVFAFSFGPPKETTGAPSENNCTRCHTGNALNAAGGSLVLTVPKTYEPGKVYDIIVKLSRNGQKRWGFQMTALNGNNVRAGSFTAIDANTKLNNFDSKYIEHTALGTGQGTPNMHSWMFRWTAPTNDVGQITFYAAGNAANNIGGAAGDYIYTQSATSEVPFHGVSLERIGGHTIEGTHIGTTTDSMEGVTYTLTVTNTGDTEDTILLSSSAEFGIEGSVLGKFSLSEDQETPTSQLELVLASDTSKTVYFTAVGDFFTKPGDYAIVVTATSKSDETKTAELTTKTTISPVPWDLNADGTVNILDLVQVTNQFGESGEGLSGDVNMDGHVNILDLVEVASYIGKTHGEIVQEKQ